MRISTYLTSLALAMPVAGFAVCAGTWTGTTNGNWDNIPSNWATCEPLVDGDTATFPIAATTSIDINIPITLGTNTPTVLFNSAVTNYTFFTSIAVPTPALTLTSTPNISLTATQTFGDGVTSYPNLVQLSGSTTLTIQQLGAGTPGSLFFTDAGLTDAGGSTSNIDITNITDALTITVQNDKAVTTTTPGSVIFPNGTISMDGQALAVTNGAIVDNTTGQGRGALFGCPGALTFTNVNPTTITVTNEGNVGSAADMAAADNFGSAISSTAGTLTMHGGSLSVTNMGIIDSTTGTANGAVVFGMIDLTFTAATTIMVTNNGVVGGLGNTMSSVNQGSLIGTPGTVTLPGGTLSVSNTGTIDSVAGTASGALFTSSTALNFTNVSPTMIIVTNSGPVGSPLDMNTSSNAGSIISSGAVTVGGGTLSVTNSATVDSITGTAAGAMFEGSNSIGLTGTTVMVTNNNPVGGALDMLGALNLGSAVSSGGMLMMSGGMVTATNSGVVDSHTSSTIGTLFSGAGGSTFTNAVTIIADNTVAVGGTSDMATAQNVGCFVGTNFAATSMAGGSLSVTNSGTIDSVTGEATGVSFAGMDLSFTSAPTIILTNNGPVGGASDMMSATNFGSIISGAGGMLTMDGGMLTVTNSATIDSVTGQAIGASFIGQTSLDFTAAAPTTIMVTNNDPVGGALDMLSAVNQGSVISSPGTVAMAAGMLTLSNLGTIDSVTGHATGTLFDGATSLDFTAASMTTTSISATNSGFVGGALDMSTAVNRGSVISSAGMVTMAGGTLSLTNSGKVDSVTGQATGVLFLSGGAFLDFTNAHSTTIMVANGGLVGGASDMSSAINRGSAISSAGTLTMDGGSLSVTNSETINGISGESTGALVTALTAIHFPNSAVSTTIMVTNNNPVGGTADTISAFNQGSVINSPGMITMAGGTLTVSNTTTGVVDSAESRARGAVFDGATSLNFSNSTTTVVSVMNSGPVGGMLDLSAAANEGSVIMSSMGPVTMAGGTLTVTNSGTIRSGAGTAKGALFNGTSALDFSAATTIMVTNTGFVGGAIETMNATNQGSVINSTGTLTMDGGTLSITNSETIDSIAGQATGALFNGVTSLGFSNTSMITMLNNAVVGGSADMSTAINQGSVISSDGTLSMSGGMLSLTNQAAVDSATGKARGVAFGCAGALSFPNTSATTILVTNDNPVGGATDVSTADNHGCIILSRTGTTTMDGGTLTLSNTSTVDSKAGTATGTFFGAENAVSFTNTMPSTMVSVMNSGPVGSSSDMASAHSFGSLLTSLTGALTMDGGTLTVSSSGTVNSPMGQAIGAAFFGLTSLGITNATTVMITNSGPVVGGGGSINNEGCIVSTNGAFAMTGGMATIANSGAIANMAGPALGATLGGVTGATFSGVMITATNSSPVGSMSTAAGNSGIFVGSGGLGTTLSLTNCTVNLTNDSGGVIGLGSGIGLRGGVMNGIIDFTTSTITATNNAPLSGPMMAGVDNLNGVYIGGGTTPGNISLHGGTLNLINSGNISGDNHNNGVIGCLVAADTFTVDTNGAVYMINSGHVTQPIAGSLNNAGVGINARTAVTLASGLIVDNGVIATPTMSVQSGTTLSGEGFIGGVLPGTDVVQVTNAGTILPGNPGLGGTPTLGTTPGGVLTVVGDYTQAAGGVLNINILNTGSYSQLSIIDTTPTMGAGSAMLNGTLNISILPGASITASDTFTLLQATGTAGLNGTTFPNVNYFNLPAGFTPILIYDPDHFVMLSFLVPSSEAAAALEALFKYPYISGSVMSSVNQLNHMTRLRKLACSGKMKNRTPKKTSKKKKTFPAWVKNKAEKIMPPRKEKKEDCEVGACEPRRWNFYIEPLKFIGGKFNTRADEVGYNYWSLGGLVGFDYSSSTYGVGFLTVYDKIIENVYKHWGKVDIDDFHTSIYAKYTPEPVPRLAFNAIAGGGYQHHKIRRNVFFPGLEAKTKASPGGNEYDGSFEIEYTIGKFKAQLIPQASLQYIRVNIDKYTEHGGGIFNLKYKRQHLDSLRSTLGVKANYTVIRSNVTFTPEISINWQREFLFKEQSLRFSAAEFSGSSASLHMPAAGRNLLLAGAELFVDICNKYEIEAHYNYEWNELFQSNYLFLGLGFRF